MASNARTNCSFGSRAAPSRITFDTDVSDKWHFPVFLVGEFGQGRAASLHFVSEWANCGPLACLAAAWISATDAALRQAAAALSPQHGPTTTPLHCPAMPVMVLPSATPPTSDSATIPTPSSGLAPVAAPAVSPSPSPCLPLRLGGVMVSQAVTAITTVSPSVHALCKEVLNRAFKCRGGIVIHLPEQGCSFLNHRVTIKDGFARGESRHIELVVVYRDHDALAACAKTILRRLDRVANDLQAEAKETLLREASIHGEATLVAHRAMHSYDMRPLRDVVFRGSSGAASSSFDDYLFAQSKKILGSFPLGPSDAKLLVTRALTIRPQLVGLVGCTSTGCTAMQPTLVLNATSPARLSLTQQSIATPPTMATGVTHTPCSASKKPLFPDAPMEIDTASTSVTRSSTSPHRFHTLSAWLSGTYQRSRSTYLEAVLWPLTLLLVNDGETPEGRVHVLPQSGATMHDVVAFQRSAEAVFGRIAWAVPPAPPSAVAAALPHVSPMPQAIDAQSDLSNTIYVHGGNGDTSVPHSISAGTGAETYGTDVPVSTFARLMAARCMFTEPDANTEREANESLKSDVEAARCASANYAISVLAKRVFLPIGERTYHRSRPAAKPESTSVFKRIVNFVANSKEKEEKEKLKQDIETKNGQREAASTALRTATLAVALNAFNALDTPQFSRGNSCSTLSPAMSSLSRDPSATLVSMSRDDSIAVGLDRQYKAKIEDELTPDLVALLKAGIAVPQDASNAVVRMEHKVCFCIARHLRRITVD